MKLTVDDIADARAYERERDEFRARVIALKKLRRISVGPVLTLVFENRDTIRFQVQEMARAERLYTDEAIQTELDTYNPLIPARGELSASLFIELTSRDEMQHWLPRLVGIETAIGIDIGEGGQAERISCDVDPEHASRLTREEITAAVHFVHFTFSGAQIERFSREPVWIVTDHPEYSERTLLSEDAKASLLADLLG